MKLFKKFKDSVINLSRLFIRGNLTVRYVFALSLMALLSLVLQVVIQRDLDHQKNRFDSIKKGRDHIETTRLLKDSLYLLQNESRPEKIKFSTQDLLTQLDIFIPSANTIWNEHSHNNISIQFAQSNSQFHQPILDVLDRIKTEKNILLQIDLKDVQKFSTTLFNLTELIIQYQELTEQELQRYEEALSTKLTNFRTLELFIFFFTLMTLLFEAIFIFRPAINKHNENFRQRSTFFSQLGHEIKNPMNSIIGMVSFLEKTQLNNFQRMYMSRLKNSAKGLLHFLENMIEFSWLENKKMEVLFEEIDLRNLLDDVLTLIANDGAKKNLGIYVLIDSAVPQFILSDYIKLKHILINLLGNAIKFTVKGHISLKIKIHETFISFIVGDTGIGISKNAQNKIFQCFFQADNSIKRNHGGSGLGLSIVQEYVDILRGKISFDSVINKGSKFEVELPISKKEITSGNKLLEKNYFLEYEHLVTIGENELNSWVTFYIKEEGITHTHYEKLHDLSDITNLASRTLVLINPSYCQSLENLKNIKNPLIHIFLAGPIKQNSINILSENIFFLYPLIPSQTLLPHLTLTKSETNVTKKNHTQFKALIYDDDSDQSLILDNYLRQLGGLSIRVNNKNDLAEQLNKKQFDIIFLDIETPETGDGKLQNDLNIDSKKLIAYTGHNPELNPGKFSAFKPGNHLIKPITLTSVAKILKKVAVIPDQQLHNNFSLDSDTFEKNVRRKLLEKRPLFLKQKTAEIQQIDHSSFEQLKFFGHKLKGSSANYGCETLSVLGRKLENSADNQLELQCNKILEEIKHYLDQESLNIS